MRCTAQSKEREREREGGGHRLVFVLIAPTEFRLDGMHLHDADINTHVYFLLSFFYYIPFYLRKKSAFIEK